MPPTDACAIPYVARDASSASRAGPGDEQDEHGLLVRHVGSYAKPAPF